MAHVGDGHSRLVAWLKIVLPLIALAILSTLFFVSRSIDPSQTIPYADVDVEGLARDQQIGAPTYTGMTEDGSAIRIAADSARPEAGGQRLIATAPSARIELPGGRIIEIHAESGRIDRDAGEAGLTGAAMITSSDGYRIETDSIVAQLDRTGMETAGPVSGTAPFGEISAGRLVLTQNPDGGYLLRFEDGVKLIYRPGT
ncbi:LPS export ABC transporter periplasmic protein LptC [Frigidibacter sp. ROC022]|uniref:LPS export ABC transporter periplasmic protein LptC n=1 Tax=Frigidibacter sp. ROC022 TaxID=2971796 RepID=UPI00215A2E2C|nr:LPS export ABC transporter periplasmic protein LptC [Frigidibacter sp. ROC022]MCR8724406.1 hypothetical protein [Frigidibacter sp. ROC022]